MEPGKPFVQSFSRQLLRLLSTAGPSVSDGPIIMEAFRSISSDQLKWLAKSISPDQLKSLLSIVPADHIKQFMALLPAEELQPLNVPAVPASPPNLAPATILQTTYENLSFDVSNPDWAKNVCGGSTIGVTPPPKWQWTPVYDSRFEREGSLENPVAGLTGWVSRDAKLSDKDVPFVHPFGFDWEFFVVPDQPYESLLAPSNTGHSSAGIDSDFQNATDHARNDLGLTAPAGVLGVETDQDLVPVSFRGQVTDGARIAVFGRWIADCGHDDFHTEIHPPLLMAVARPTPLTGDPDQPPGGLTEVTSVRIMSRPFTVSQQFDEGNFVAHLITEVGKVEATGLFGIPLSVRVEAHPNVFTRPYDGLTLIKLLVKPPSPRRTPLDRLKVSFHFTHRRGVAVQVFNAGSDTVAIMMVLGELRPATLPTKSPWNISVQELIRLDPDNGSLYADVIFASVFLNPVAAAILARGILTDRYDPPSASSPVDNTNVAFGVPVEQLNATIGVSEDDAQPFPIYGWLNVAWQRGLRPVPQPTPTE
jgi:hypothetical protein